ncbi:hypothetical protein [Lacisediminihabitans sp. H27-G8]|uniref:hypothetical protein n=1 Tax=Lacisediminihabitans sp. H27-G8 TaxID=3111909 RepID=UPI0038FC676F
MSAAHCNSLMVFASAIALLGRHRAIRVAMLESALPQHVPARSEELDGRDRDVGIAGQVDPDTVEAGPATMVRLVQAAHLSPGIRADQRCRLHARRLTST